MRELQLKLQLEKEFLNKKYKVLEDVTSSDDESVCVVAGEGEGKEVEDWLQTMKEANDIVSATGKINDVPPLVKQKDVVEKIVKLNAGALPFHPTSQTEIWDRQVDPLEGTRRLTRE